MKLTSVPWDGEVEGDAGIIRPHIGLTFEHEHPYSRSREALEARARSWGWVFGLAAAETFVVARGRW